MHQSEGHALFHSPPGRAECHVVGQHDVGALGFGAALRASVDLL